MKSPFRRAQPQGSGEVPLEEVLAQLPASARAPDAQRLAPADAISDAPDADLDFLTSLMAAVEHNTAAPMRSEVAGDGGVRAFMAESRRAEPEQRRIEPDGLQAFREMREARMQDAPTLALSVRDVELGDLLEDLSTTASALRNLRAA